VIRIELGADAHELEARRAELLVAPVCRLDQSVGVHEAPVADTATDV
jgi:hypothetical protein